MLLTLHRADHNRADMRDSASETVSEEEEDSEYEP